MRDAAAERKAEADFLIESREVAIGSEVIGLALVSVVGGGSGFEGIRVRVC